MDQLTSAPTAKMTAVGTAGSIVTLIVGVLTAFGVSVPSDVSGAVITAVAALTTIISFASGYIKRERKVA